MASPVAIAEKEKRAKLTADPTISVKDLQAEVEKFMFEQKSRDLKKLLGKGMVGHNGNAHGKYTSLAASSTFFEGLATLAPNQR